MLELVTSKPHGGASPRRSRILRRLMPCHDSNVDMFDIEEDIFIFESAEEREAREIRTQQNERALIARLPPEILADIFVRCVPTSVRKLHSDFSWLNVTRVSSQWRNVALACPDFWSTLIFSRPRWTPVMLARSKMASLAVRVDLKKDHANSPEPILLENASRLGTLDLRSPQFQLSTFLANLEHVDAAPRLQFIKVVNTDLDNLGEGGMWLPRNLFRRTEVMQSRKSGTQLGVRLHLECCAFPWDSGWYFHLTHLHLENINPTQRPTMEAFLGILVGSPYLQILTVIHCSPTTRRGFAVDLPHLTALTIKSDSSSTCARMLSYLIIPPSATINASCTVRSNPDSRCYLPESPIFEKGLTQYRYRHAIFQSLIPEFSEDAAPTTYDTVRITHKDGFTFSLLHSAVPEWSRKVRLDATTWPPNNILRATESVRDHLDFSHVTTLHLQGMHNMPHPPDDGVFALWDTLGRNLRHVETLHLHKSFPGAWLEFLLTQAMLLIGVSHYKSCFNLPKSQHGLAFRDPDGGLTHAWPALRRLALHGIDLGQDYAAHPSPSPADVLRALLWARREGRTPIWRLEIEDCDNVYTQDLAHFRLFADVVYDGKGQKRVFKADDGEESLRSYSINVFADMIEQARPSTRE
ncbi:hypothetical protein B0H19DRAFT_515185 [Mycena capillaripes]|nr:hypothetical protein B0H19DRAFT_515185 [Mycena capillaripes]